MAEKQEVCFRIGREGLRIADVQAAAREAWKQMREPGTLAHANALARGVDPQTLPSQLDRVLRLRPNGAGISTVDVLVMVAGSGAGTVGAKIAWDLWKYVVLAHIRYRWGDHALREKRAELRRAAAAKKTTTKNKKAAR